MFAGASIAPSSSARWALSGSVSKKPSCSALVSSSPIGLPCAGERAAQHRLDALVALEAEVLELVAEQHEGRGPGLHPVERRRAESPLLAIAASSAARFAGGTRSAIGGRPWRSRAWPGSPISCLGFLSSTMVSTHQLVASRRPPCRTSAVRQLHILGQQMDGAEQIDGRVGVATRSTAPGRPWPRPPGAAGAAGRSATNAPRPISELPDTSFQHAHPVVAPEVDGLACRSAKAERPLARCDSHSPKPQPCRRTTGAAA